MSQLDPYIGLHGFMQGTQSGMEAQQHERQNRLALAAQAMEQERMAIQSQQFQQGHQQSADQFNRSLAQGDQHFQQSQDWARQVHNDQMGNENARLGMSQEDHALRMGQQHATEMELESIAQDVLRPGPASQQQQAQQQPQGPEAAFGVTPPNQAPGMIAQPASSTMDLAKQSAAAQIRNLRGLPAELAIKHATELRDIVREAESNSAQADALEARYKGSLSAGLAATTAAGLRNNARGATHTLISQFMAIQARQEIERQKTAKFDPSTPEGQEIFQAFKVRYPKLSDQQIGAQMKLRGAQMVQEQRSNQSGYEQDPVVRQAIDEKRALLQGDRHPEDTPAKIQRLQQLDQIILSRGKNPEDYPVTPDDGDGDIDPSGPDQDPAPSQASGSPGPTQPPLAQPKAGKPSAGPSEDQVRGMVRKVLDDAKRQGRTLTADQVKKLAMERLKQGMK